jgi:Na+/melibiose symporter-like transporter
MQHGRLRSSVEVLSGTAYTAPSAVVAGLLAKKFLRFRPQIWAGWALVTIGMGLTTLMTPDSNGGILYGLRIFAAIGAGFLFPLPVFAAQINQQNRDVGIATSLIAFFRSLGQAFGVAIGAVIFQNQ